ncbi:hypothetical protein P8452_62049 [Trifolium repens]|nr:hypothetical protein P8452_62049 [Trifolium repens]
METKSQPSFFVYRMNYKLLPSIYSSSSIIPLPLIPSTETINPNLTKNPIPFHGFTQVDLVSAEGFGTIKELEEELDKNNEK